MRTRVEIAMKDRGISNERIETLVRQWLAQEPPVKEVDEIGHLLKEHRPAVHKRLRDDLRRIIPYHDE